jgi:ubiquinol-cytochrome c reductase cytochrome c1 subunit
MRIAKSLLIAATLGIAGLAGAGALAAGHPLHKDPVAVDWPHEGVFGRFDRAQLQRGFQVYKEVCAACHSLHLVAFRSLQDLGFDEAEVKALAKNWTTEIPTINDTGEATTRKALPSDLIPGPYANEVAARAANNNAMPPDLSLIVKAREGKEEYLYSLLTGYTDPPKTYQEKNPRTGKMEEVPFVVDEGLHYNPYFSTVKIAMAQPMQDGQVTYADGTQATISQMSKDVTAFLTWAAEPHMESRKHMGVGVLMFLAIMIGLSWSSYQRIWRDVKGH